MDTNSCPKCGHNLTGQPKFCPECGAPLTAEPQQQTPRSAPSTGRMLRDIGILAAVLLLVAIGYAMWRGPHTPDTSVAEEAPGGGMAEAEAELLNNLPDDYDQLVQMGNAQMDKQDFPVAAEIYAKALEIHPEAVDVRTDYGACLHSMGLSDRAQEEFRRVLKDDPTHAIALFNMGVVFFTEDKADSARVYLKKYLKQDPGGPASESAQSLLNKLAG